MSGSHSVVGRIAIVVALIAVPFSVSAQTFTIVSNFDGDTPGSPPAVGGVNQPTGIMNGGVLVQATANGVTTQPVTADDGSCNQNYVGGVYFDLPAPVTIGGLRVEVTFAANQLTDGVVLDTGISYLSASIARMSIENDGTITDHFGTVLSSYAPDTPVRLRADLDMSSQTWAATIDDELNGFADDPVVSGLPFVNPPSVITHIGVVYLALFGSFSSCTGSRIVAYDDVLIFDIPPLFADGFETGDTAAWTLTVP